MTIAWFLVRHPKLLKAGLGLLVALYDTCKDGVFSAQDEIRVNAQTHELAKRYRQARRP